MAAGQEAADLGGGNLQGGHGMKKDLARGLRTQGAGAVAAALVEGLAQDFGELRRRPPRPARDHQMGEVEDFLPVVPGVKTEKGIHADDHRQHRLGPFAA